MGTYSSSNAENPALTGLAKAIVQPMNGYLRLLPRIGWVLTLRNPAGDEGKAINDFLRPKSCPSLKEHCGESFQRAPTGRED